MRLIRRPCYWPRTFYLSIEYAEYTHALHVVTSESGIRPFFIHTKRKAGFTQIHNTRATCTRRVKLDASERVESFPIMVTDQLSALWDQFLRLFTIIIIMANLIRSAKSASDWSIYDLLAFNIEVVPTNAADFFADPELPEPSISRTIHDNLQMPDGNILDDERDFFPHLSSVENKMLLDEWMTGNARLLVNRSWAIINAHRFPIFWRPGTEHRLAGRESSHTLVIQKKLGDEDQCLDFRQLSYVCLDIEWIDPTWLEFAYLEVRTIFLYKRVVIPHIATFTVPLTTNCSAHLFGSLQFNFTLYYPRFHFITFRHVYA